MRDLINPTPAPQYGPHRLVGRTLQGRRAHAGLTLRRCAELMGTSMAEWSRVEQGWRPPTHAERARFERALEDHR